MKNCTNCNLTFEDDKKFCNKCGSSLTLVIISESNDLFSKYGKKCLNCNLNYDEDKKFCNKCGSPLSIIKQTVSKVDAKKFVFEEKLKQDLLNVELLREYAQFLFENSEFKDAINVLLRILAINDGDILAKRLLFNSLLEAKQFDDAFEIGEELLLTNPSDISLLEQLAVIANTIGNRDIEIKFLNKIIEIDDGNIYALKIIANEYVNTNNIEEALKICSKLEILGQKDILVLIYSGINYALNGKYDLSIKSFNSITSMFTIDIHSNRLQLYWSYSLCMVNEEMLIIEDKFSLIDFEVLKENYFVRDEEIASKTVNYIINNQINTLELTQIEYYYNKYLVSKEFYFTEISDTEIAACWYEIAKKQNEFELFHQALFSFQKAISIMPDNLEIMESLTETQALIKRKKNKKQKNNIIAICSITLVLFIGYFTLISTLKHIENNTWTILNDLNTIASYNDYLTKFPKGIYVNVAKERVDEILWAKALQTNTYEGYKFYAVSSYNRKYAHQADSLGQSALWSNAVVKDSYEAYQKYIELFPNGNFSERAIKIADGKLWKIVETNGTEADYKLYLNRFPDGKYAQKAKNYLDENLWNTTESLYTQSAFENYKNNFPNGNHITEANAIIEYYKAIENRKSDLSWLIGTWSVQTNYGYSSLKIYDSRNAYSDGESGTYSVEGNVLTVHTTGGYGVTYSINYESMTLGLGGGYVMRK